jgi:hypothetical protein
VSDIVIVSVTMARRMARARDCRRQPNHENDTPTQA